MNLAFLAFGMYLPSWDDEPKRVVAPKKIDTPPAIGETLLRGRNLLKVIGYVEFRDSEYVKCVNLNPEEGGKPIVTLSIPQSLEQSPFVKRRSA